MSLAASTDKQLACELSHDQLTSVLSYDAESGEFTWLRPACRRLKPGMRAGRNRHDGYVAKKREMHEGNTL